MPLHDSKWKGKYKILLTCNIVVERTPLILANELLTNKHQGSLKITVIPNNIHTKGLPIFFFFFFFFFKKQDIKLDVSTIDGLFTGKGKIEVKT